HHRTEGVRPMTLSDYAGRAVYLAASMPERQDGRYARVRAMLVASGASVAEPVDTGNEDSLDALVAAMDANRSAVLISNAVVTLPGGVDTPEVVLALDAGMRVDVIDAGSGAV